MIDVTKLPSSDKPDTKIEGINVKNLPDADTKPNDPNPYLGGTAAGSMGRIQGDVTKYQPYFDNLVPMYQSRAALDEARAQNQTGWQLFKGAMDQAVMGTLVGNTIESVGTLGKLFTIGKVIAETDGAFQENLMQELGRSIREAAQERSPIYQTQRAQEGGLALSDPTWWASHVPSIVSTLSIMIPAGVGAKLTTKLLMGLGKSGKILLNGTKVVKAFDKAKDVKSALDLSQSIKASGAINLFNRSSEFYAKTVIAGIYSRHIDSYQEAAENYRMMYDNFKGMQYSDEDAHKLAAKGAAHTYKMGYLNLPIDIIQWGTMFKYGDLANRAINANVAAALHKTTHNNLKLFGPKAAEGLGKIGASAKEVLKFKNVAKDVLIEGAGEGLEEFIIGFGRKEGERLANITAGIYTPDKFDGLLKRIGTHTVDPHTWDEMFWGALGGMLFGTVQAGIEARGVKKMNEQADKAMDSLSKRVDEISSSYKAMEEALNNGNTAEASSIIIKMQEAILQNGLVNGTIGLDIEVLRNISELTDDQITQVGFNPGTQQDIKAFANTLEKYSKLYNQHANLNYGYEELDSAIAIQLTGLQFSIDKANEYLAEFEKGAKEDSMTDEQITEMFGNASVSQLLKSKQQIAAAEQINTIMSRAINNLVAENTTLENAAKLATSLEKMKLEVRINKNNTVINGYKKSIDNNERVRTIHTEAKTRAQSVVDAMSETEKANVEQFIKSNLSKEKNIYDIAIQTMTALKEYNEGQMKNLLTKEGMDSYIKSLKETSKIIAEEHRTSFVEEADTATTEAELDSIHEKYNKKYSDLYKARKQAIKDKTEKESKQKEFESKIIDLANKIHKGDINFLTSEDTAFYNTHRQAVDKELSKLIEADKKAKTTTSTPITPVVETQEVNWFDDLIEKNAPYERVSDKSQAVPVTKSILNEEGIIAKFDGNAKQAYINMIMLYEVLFNMANNHDSLNSEQKEYFKKVLTQIPSVYAQIYGDNYDDNLIRITDSEALIPYLEGLSYGNDGVKINIMVTQINGIYKQLIKPVNTTTKTKEDIFNEKVNSIGKEGFDLFADESKESKELTDAVKDETSELLTKPIQLANQLADVLAEYFSDTDSPVTINLETVYHLMVTNDNIDNFRKYWWVYRNLFDAYVALNIEGKQLESNPNITFDFKARPKNIGMRGTPNKGFVDSFLQSYINPISSGNTHTGTHIYLQGLVDAKSFDNVSEQTADQIQALRQLEINDELSFELDNNYVDGRFDETTNQERNNNPNTVPINIISNKTGKPVKVGMLQTTDMVHEGINYKNEDGKFNPFSATVNNKDAEVLLKNLKLAHELYVALGDNKNIDFNAKKYDAIRDVITKLVSHNNSIDKVIQNNQIKHVLEPLFFNVNKINYTEYARTATVNTLLNRYKGHLNRFQTDYNNVLEIRTAIADGKDVRLSVSEKAMPAAFELDNYTYNLYNIEDTNIDGENRIHIAVPSKTGKQLIDPKTGKPITINNEVDMTTTQFHSIHEVKPGVFHAYKLREAGLIGDEGEAIKQYIVDALFRLAGNPTPEMARQISDSLENYVAVTYKDTTTNINFKVQRYTNKEGKIEPKILIRGNDKMYHEIEIRGDKIRIYTSELNDNGGLANKGEEYYKEYDRANGIRVAKDLLSNVRRSVKMNMDNRTISSDKPFIGIDGTPYESYYDYVFKTGALVTNLQAIRYKGKVISNFNHAKGKNRPVSTLFVKHEISEPNTPKSIINNVEYDTFLKTGVVSDDTLNKIAEQAKIGELTNRDKEVLKHKELQVAKQQKTDEQAKLIEEVSSRYLGKSLKEILASDDLKGFAFFNELLDKLGIDVKFNDTITEGKDSTSQLSMTQDTIFMHPAFILSTANKALSDTDRNLIIVHETLHFVIDAAEAKMTEEQRANYIKQLKDFREEVRLAFNKSNLTPAQNQAMGMYLLISNRPGNHSETITYAFTNPIIAEVLGTLQSDTTVKEGFWTKLYNIIANIFDITEGTKLAELTNLLNNILNIDAVSVQETKVETEVKKDTPVEPTTKVRGKRGKATGDNTTINSLVITGTSQANAIYQQYSSQIQARYGLNEQQFVEHWNQLTPEERVQELKCL
jgi:hypothetical protein